jgi:hypothetical protein
MTGIRKWHSYIGLFIAPSVLFFALTGAAQLFNLHEGHGNYQPAAIVEKLSSVHKDQVFEFGDHHAQPAPGTDAAKPDAGSVPEIGAEDKSDGPKPSTLLLKAFFLVVALCLTISTSLGMWMGLKQMRRKWVAWLLVAAGAVIPVGLLIS